MLKGTAKQARKRNAAFNLALDAHFRGLKNPKTQIISRVNVVRISLKAAIFFL
jgi:hypothetical protein